MTDHAGVLALVERGRLADAAREITALIRSTTPERAAELRLTAAWIELDRGRLAGCARQVALARPFLGGDARADCLDGLLRCASGDHRRAVAELTAVLPTVRGRWLANARVGRGTANAYLHRVREADADFAAAARHYATAGERVRAAACVHNQGFVALQAGDLPLALRRFGEAEAAGLLASRHPEILVDRAQALVAAGLAGDARPVLAKAAALLAEAGRGTKLAEATLAVAQCALRAGQLDIAADAADRAAAAFGRQGRDSWRAAARAVRLTAVPGRPHVMSRVAAQCDGYGWWQAAAELRLAAGSLADVAARRHSGPAALRALGWLARARSATDRRAVFAACAAGLRAVRADAATMGAWELRAGMAAHTVELAELGLAAALAGGRARTVLRWTDRCRAVAGERSAVLPPSDPVQAQRLMVLRAAITAGGSPARVRRLEQRVRARDLAGECPASAHRDWTFTELSAALGDAALVSFFVHDGLFRAIEFSAGRCRLRTVGTESTVDRLVRAARLGSADRLADVLGLRGSRPLVVVPVGCVARRAVGRAALVCRAASFRRAVDKRLVAGASAGRRGSGLDRRTRVAARGPGGPRRCVRRTVGGC